MCNLKCVWCDTKYTWDWQGEFGKQYNKVDEVKIMDFDDVESELMRHTAGNNQELLVVSGGEPMLQNRQLLNFFDRVHDLFDGIEIETNGTIRPMDAAISAYAVFNVSPKLRNSGNSREKSLNSQAMEYYASDYRNRFKFVVTSLEDLDEIVDIANTYDIPDSQIWVMPEGTDPERILFGMTNLADAVIQKGFNLTTRLHVLLWGNTRGR